MTQRISHEGYSNGRNIILTIGLHLPLKDHLLRRYHYDGSLAVVCSDVCANEFQERNHRLMLQLLIVGMNLIHPGIE